MLSDPAEIAIIAKAGQANVRDPKRSRQHLAAIFEDFLAGVPFAGQTVLDIGPGQYDFGEMARARGASVIGIDGDPAVIELDRYKRFEVIKADLRDFHRGRLAAPAHGIFCEYSLNTLWFPNDERGLRAHTQSFIDALRSDGWAWIAPWNASPKALALSAAQEEAVLDVQRDCFRGPPGSTSASSARRRRGITGSTATRPTTPSLPVACSALSSRAAPAGARSEVRGDAPGQEVVREGWSIPS